MLASKDDIEDDFQGYGSEETLRLCEFLYNCIHELLITFGTAKRAILENQPDKNASREQAQQEQKKALILADSKAKIERLNNLVYEIMVTTCYKFKAIMRMVAKAMLSSEFSNFAEGDYVKLFNKLEQLFTGK